MQQAGESGRRSAGNAKAKGNIGNAGNAKGKGNIGNAGNETRGKIKKRAGQRSGLRRRAAVALIIKEYWLKKIFNHEKQWEIRGAATARRGRIHLAQPGGLLVGSAVISGCTQT